LPCPSRYTLFPYTTLFRSFSGTTGQWHTARNLPGFTFNHRKENREGRSLVATAALGNDAAIVHFDQGFANGEAQPESAQSGLLRLLKGVKNFRERFRIYAETGIGDGHTQFSIGFAARVDGEPSALGSKFYCVFDQVPKD